MLNIIDIKINVIKKYSSVELNGNLFIYTLVQNIQLSVRKMAFCFSDVHLTLQLACV